jgi:nucleotide-binding universal stress UspA family protein
MKSILVGVDGSVKSREALRFAARIAAGLRAKLHLVWVAPQLEPMGVPDFPPAIREWNRANEERGRAMLREIVDSELHPFGDPDVVGEPLTAELPEIEVNRGSAAEQLALRAERPDVELVVVGARGKDAAGRLLLGSVADRLARTCPKPVLICN